MYVKFCGQILAIPLMYVNHLSRRGPLCKPRCWAVLVSSGDFACSTSPLECGAIEFIEVCRPDPYSDSADGRWRLAEQLGAYTDLYDRDGGEALELVI